MGPSWVLISMVWYGMLCRPVNSRTPCLVTRLSGVPVPRRRCLDCHRLHLIPRNRRQTPRQRQLNQQQEEGEARNAARSHPLTEASLLMVDC